MEGWGCEWKAVFSQVLFGLLMEYFDFPDMTLEMGGALSYRYSHGIMQTAELPYTIIQFARLEV